MELFIAPATAMYITAEKYIATVMGMCTRTDVSSGEEMSTDAQV